MPTTERLSIAMGVNCNVCALIVSAMPGTSRSMTLRAASGVTSCRPMPVPPVVTMRSTSLESAQASNAVGYRPRIVGDDFVTYFFVFRRRQLFADGLAPTINALTMGAGSAYGEDT